MLEGDYRSYTEDRLTQITAACFNQSIAFRKIFLTFLGVSKKIVPSKCTARTQISTVGRLDLAIYNGGRIAAIVENKVDAPLHPNQLKNYSSDRDLKSAKKIALVKNYFPHDRAYGEWEILHWRDYYLALFELVKSPKKLSAIDKFIAQNFINYLENANMHVPTRISKSAMNALAKALHRLRYPEKTKFGWFSMQSDIFQTAADWVRMMEAIFEESRSNKQIAKVAKKNYRFSPQLGHWWEEGKDKSKYYRWIGINSYIHFRKTHGKTKGVGVGLFVDDDGKWNIMAYRNSTALKVIHEVKIADSHNDVVLANATKKVLRKWKQWTN